MARKPTRSRNQSKALAHLACPNEDCSAFNRFDAGNLSIVEWIGKGQRIRRLYCCHCGQRFSERRGTLRQYTKVPDETLQRILKCLSHGCSVTASADICAVDPRTVQRVLRQAGPRADDFHRTQVVAHGRPVAAAQLDELHGRVCPPKKKAARQRRGVSSRRSLGKAWIHAALAVESRFLLDVRVGPRTLALAKELVASVAWSGVPGEWPLFLVDDHLPYPRAILEVCGQIRHRRRHTRRGRKKHPDLKPPAGLWAGAVQKVRSPTGSLLAVKTRVLFGRKRDVRQRIGDLGIGSQINTSHLERLNGTMRGQQARLARRSQSVSRVADHLQWSLWLWRDFYNWVHRHGGLQSRTPAMAHGLSRHVWSVAEYLAYPVHVGPWQRLIWAEERQNLLRSALLDEKL